MHNHWLIICLLIFSAICLVVAGVLVGIWFRSFTNLLNDALERLHNLEREPDEDASAVVDSSPQVLRQKRFEKIRKGEEPDNPDSQIVTVKSPQQLRAESAAAKESRLDKWMPGIRRGK